MRGDASATHLADPTRVLAEQQKARRSIARHCVAAVAVPVLLMALMAYGDWILDTQWGNTGSPQPLDFGNIDLTVAGTPAAAAFAVLGGVIVALQVAARPSPSIVDGDHDQIIARVTVLERLAQASGMAAGGLGVLTAWHVGLDQIVHRPAYVLGPVLLGVLLCAVASDAGTASQAKYGRAMADEIARQRRERAQAELAGMPTRARADGWGDMAVQVGLAVVLSLSFAGIAVSISPLPWTAGAGLALLTLVGFALTAGSWSLAEFSLRMRHWTDGVSATLMGILIGLLVVVTSLQIMLEPLRDSDVMAVVRSVVMALFQLLALVLVAAGVARVDRPRVQGRGRTYVLRALAKAAAEPQDTAPRKRSASGRALLVSSQVVLLLLAGFVPPVGFPVALRCRRSGVTPAVRRAATTTLVLSTLVCLFLIIVALFGGALSPA